jgi:hypothetical protein
MQIFPKKPNTHIVSNFISINTHIISNGKGLHRDSSIEDQKRN